MVARAFPTTSKTALFLYLVLLLGILQLSFTAFYSRDFFSFHFDFSSHNHADSSSSGLARDNYDNRSPRQDRGHNSGRQGTESVLDKTENGLFDLEQERRRIFAVTHEVRGVYQPNWESDTGSFVLDPRKLLSAPDVFSQSQAPPPPPPRKKKQSSIFNDDDPDAHLQQEEELVRRYTIKYFANHENASWMERNVIPLLQTRPGSIGASSSSSSSSSSSPWYFSKMDFESPSPPELFSTREKMEQFWPFLKIRSLPFSERSRGNGYCFKYKLDSVFLEGEAASTASSTSSTSTTTRVDQWLAILTFAQSSTTLTSTTASPTLHSTSTNVVVTYNPVSGMHKTWKQIKYTAPSSASSDFLAFGPELNGRKRSRNKNERAGGDDNANDDSTSSPPMTSIQFVKVSVSAALPTVTLCVKATNAEASSRRDATGAASHSTSAVDLIVAPMLVDVATSLEGASPSAVDESGGGGHHHHEDDGHQRQGQTKNQHQHRSSSSSRLGGAHHRWRSSGGDPSDARRSFGADTTATRDEEIQARLSFRRKLFKGDGPVAHCVGIVDYNADDIVDHMFRVSTGTVGSHAASRSHDNDNNSKRNRGNTRRKGEEDAVQAKISKKHFSQLLRRFGNYFDHDDQMQYLSQADKQMGTDVENPNSNNISSPSATHQQHPGQLFRAQCPSLESQLSIQSRSTQVQRKLTRSLQTVAQQTHNNNNSSKNNNNNREQRFRDDTIPIKLDKNTDCVIASAIMGPSELGCPRSPRQYHRCALLMFSERADAPFHRRCREGGWTVVSTPYYLLDPALSENADNFQKSKFYKMMTYKLLPAQVRYLFWMDGTVRMVFAETTAIWIELLNRGLPLVVGKHAAESSLYELSQSFAKYHFDFEGNRYEKMLDAFLQHIAEGYCDNAFLSFPVPSRGDSVDGGDGNEKKKYQHNKNKKKRVITPDEIFKLINRFPIHRCCAAKGKLKDGVLVGSVNQKSDSGDLDNINRNNSVAAAGGGRNGGGRGGVGVEDISAIHRRRRRLSSSILDDQDRLDTRDADCVSFARRAAAWVASRPTSCYRNPARPWQAAHPEPMRALYDALSRNVHLTCVVGVDLRQPWVKPFLDTWYDLTADHLQDQVSFPVALWRAGIQTAPVDDFLGYRDVLNKNAPRNQQRRFMSGRNDGINQNSEGLENPNQALVPRVPSFVKMFHRTSESDERRVLERAGDRFGGNENERRCRVMFGYLCKL